LNLIFHSGNDNTSDYHNKNERGQRMGESADLITNDLARRIYLDLKQGSNGGEIPFRDYDFTYSLEERNEEDNSPVKVKIKITNLENQRVDKYSLVYNDSFSDYNLLQGNMIIF